MALFFIVKGISPNICILNGHVQKENASVQLFECIFFEELLATIKST